MRVYKNISVPHPFPYQGSKRAIAKYILPYFPIDTGRLIEPFCGASAISLAAAANGFATQFVLNDINKPLIGLWSEILHNPDELCAQYKAHWNQQQSDPKGYFFKIREEFNSFQQPHQLLYLLARIVKGSVRYSSDGNFNQSADNRRVGMRPQTMRKNIISVSFLLRNRTVVSALDFRHVVETATNSDLIYMDPPYQGTSFTRDHRYLNGLPYEDFVKALKKMNDKDLSYIISYDGTTGNKFYGRKLPDELKLKHLEIQAGRSSQATLLGRNCETIESLYLSPSLIERLKRCRSKTDEMCVQQAELAIV